MVVVSAGSRKTLHDIFRNVIFTFHFFFFTNSNNCTVESKKVIDGLVDCKTDIHGCSNDNPDRMASWIVEPKMLNNTEEILTVTSTYFHYHFVCFHEISSKIKMGECVQVYLVENACYISFGMNKAEEHFGLRSDDVCLRMWHLISQSLSSVLHRALNIHPFRSILIIKMITAMKDRTLLAGLWGDYIVNDSDTDGHKLLITSEMTLHSDG